MAIHQGPALKLDVVGQGDSFTWKIQMHAKDAVGLRWLGYRAEGDDLALAVAEPTFAIAVNDADRPNWTPMPSSDRKDLRKAIHATLAGALSALENKGK